MWTCCGKAIRIINPQQVHWRIPVYSHPKFVFNSFQGIGIPSLVADIHMTIIRELLKSIWNLLSENLISFKN